MAHIDCSFYSESLLKNVHVIVYLPTVSADDMLEERPVHYYEPEHRFPVLYLLHGMYGDCLDWPLRSGIERYAQDLGVAVVMPSGENSYYTNMERGERYLDYVGRELPEFISKMFPVSTKREETWTAGLSMGGYGAWLLALTFPERFGAAAALSGVLDPRILLTGDSMHMKKWSAAYRRSVVEDPEHFHGTDLDLLVLLGRLREESKPLPRLYMTVGTEDFVFPLNESVHRELEQHGIPVVYETWPGEHNWDFWDAHIQDALRFLTG